MNWEKRLAYPNGTFTTSEKNGTIRRYKVVASEIEHELVSGVKIKGMGYNQSTPGPLLVFEQGETVEVEVTNQLDEPTAFHVHGLSKPNSQDGVPEIEPTPSIEPGKSYTYRFVAWQSGTFLYHSSDAKQVAQGMVGPFVVLPKDQQDTPYMDYVIFLQQWQINALSIEEVTPGLYKLNPFDRDPNFFTINGKSFPDTVPLYTRYGEKIRVRFINKSTQSHSMHFHGHDFRVVEVNGFPRDPVWDDTIDVPSSNRIDIEIPSNNPGVWPINGTKVFHQTNNGKTPGGMSSRLIYLK